MVSELSITIQNYITAIIFLVGAMLWYKLKSENKLDKIKLKDVVSTIMMLTFSVLVNVLDFIPVEIRKFLSSGIMALVLLYFMINIFREYKIQIGSSKPLKINIKHEALMPQVRKLEALKKKVDKELADGKRQVKESQEELDSLRKAVERKAKELDEMHVKALEEKNKYKSLNKQVNKEKDNLSLFGHV